MFFLFVELNSILTILAFLLLFIGLLLPTLYQLFRPKDRMRYLCDVCGEPIPYAEVTFVYRKGLWRFYCSKCVDEI